MCFINLFHFTKFLPNFNMSYTTAFTSGSGTFCHSGVLVFIFDFSGVPVAYLSFCVMFCWPLFVFFRVFSVLRFTASNYQFGIFKIGLTIPKSIRSRISKDMQYNGYKKKNKGKNNDLQNRKLKIEQYELH